ncbi:hypothetical protein [Spirosoma fluviale]|uniref:DUF1574 domain-containing protein n=1 Tax=Spirosoma fluviale TaxID=1597977 RepID=A0A286GJT6_9BACT|nr:hypothetical protein [Spirosoma fluviale]SOD95788.1 hypothetical protein SAMN06269250_4977 [Spirosoma fluviale]
MYTLLYKTTLLVSALVLTLCILYQYVNQHQEANYFSSIVDKQNRAESLKDRHRLLLVGGSGTAFGIDSELLEDSLRIPVVNLAMHVGLGLPFMLKQVQSIAHSGDIVLLTPEYFLSDGDEYMQFYTGVCYSPALNYITFDHPLSFAIRRVNYWIRRIQSSFLLVIEDESSARISDTTSVYFRAGFSPRGDLISPLNNRAPDKIAQLEIKPLDYKKEIALINALAKEFRHRNVSLLLTYPALSASTFMANQPAIETYTNLMKKLELVNVLSHPTKNMYPDSCFFDSAYHLNSAGRHNRSLQLSSLLKPLMHHVNKPTLLSSN